MIGFYLALAFGRLLSWLPFWVLYLFSDFIKFVLQYVLKYRNHVIMGNLKRSFPGKSEEWYRKKRNKFYRNFADIIVESFKSLSISAKAMKKRFTLINGEVFDKLYAENRGVIMVMGHQTNFEWVATAIPLLVKQNCYAVYHKLKNPRFNKLIVSIREKFGLKLFPMAETYPFMLNNPDKAPLYVFMADQSPHKGKIRYRAQFLNQSTPVHLGVENLSKKCDLAVVFIDIQRTKRGHYQITPQLLYNQTQTTAQYEVTDRHVKALEENILRSPENWLWSHKRWKHA